jgi:hypothetical protein
VETAQPPTMVARGLPERRRTKTLKGL